MEWSRASYRSRIWKFSISTFLCNNVEKILINVSPNLIIEKKLEHFNDKLYNFLQDNISIENRYVILVKSVLRVLDQISVFT